METSREREKELRALFEGLDDDVKALIGPTVDNVLWLEKKMDEFRQLPMIHIHPRDHNRQRSTPAAKLYKEFLQQYTNNIKILLAVLDKNAPDEESPLRAWLNERRQQHGRA